MDWAGLMRVGLNGLGLNPEAFWRMTPAELEIMAGLAPGSRPLDRARLFALAKAFPDATEVQDGS